MFVRIPFTNFQVAVLGVLNIALTQLHPNSWASMQAFVVVCFALGITLTTAIFFHFFNVHLIAKRG